MEGPITGQSHPLLMVIGGLDNNGKALGDVWLLDVDKGKWEEVRHNNIIIWHIHVDICAAKYPCIMLFK